MRALILLNKFGAVDCALRAYGSCGRRSSHAYLSQPARPARGRHHSTSVARTPDAASATATADARRHRRVPCAWSRARRDGVPNKKGIP